MHHPFHFTRALICSVFNPLLVIQTGKIVGISVEEIINWIPLLHFVSLNFWRLIVDVLHSLRRWRTLVKWNLLDLLKLLRSKHADLFCFDQMLLAIGISWKASASFEHFPLDRAPLRVSRVNLLRHTQINILNYLLVLNLRVIILSHPRSLILGR